MVDEIMSLFVLLSLNGYDLVDSPPKEFLVQFRYNNHFIEQLLNCLIGLNSLNLQFISCKGSDLNMITAIECTILARLTNNSKLNKKLNLSNDSNHHDETTIRQLKL